MFSCRKIKSSCYFKQNIDISSYRAPDTDIPINVELTSSPTHTKHLITLQPPGNSFIRKHEHIIRSHFLNFKRVSCSLKLHTRAMKNTFKKHKVKTNIK